jgi:hypothetical protein
MSTHGMPDHAPVSRTMRQSALDRMFFWIVTRGWSDRELAEYPARVNSHDENLPQSMIASFGQIDGKATGLLAHVSLMIAGLGLVAPLVVDSELEKGVLVAEIAFYLLLAVGCLRCLAVFRSSELRRNTAENRALATHELILRRELYSLCNRAAIYLTIAVFVVLPFLYFYKPEPSL